MAVSGSASAPSIQRLAVGDHLLLGGDNMDAALAYHLERQLFDGDPSALQWMQLKAEVRAAKETMLADQAFQGSCQVALQGSGAAVVGGMRTAEISRDALMRILLDGFFGQYALSEALQLKKSSGMRAMGLPYESEPSITKHLAHFLQQSAEDKAHIASPDFVLFNGGTMQPEPFQSAIMQSLETWFPGKVPKLLPSYHLHLAVARGASYYGKVRRGRGVKIAGGMARGYYLGIDTQSQSGELAHCALTLLPRGSDDGASYQPEQPFFLRPNVPVAFQLYSSHVRLHDESGVLIAIDAEQLQKLPPVNTILSYGKQKTAPADEVQLIPVYLSIQLNGIGILELALKSKDSSHVWKLEFQLRTAQGQDDTLAVLSSGRNDELIDQADLAAAKKCIAETFAPHGSRKPERLMDALEQLLQKPRRSWPPSVLRGLSEPLLQAAPYRKLTASHEVRWWHLAGFLLMPGRGYPLDDFRLKELWKIVLSDSKAASSAECQIQKWICYRRVAAGFSKGQQLQIGSELATQLFNKKGKIDLKGKADYHAYGEKIRAIAALELIDQTTKVKVGEALVERIVRGEALSVDYWALGRIAGRQLLYGSSVNVLSKEVCGRWLKALLSVSHSHLKEFTFMVGQLARKSDCREINLPQSDVEPLLEYFANHPQLQAEYAALQQILAEVTPLSALEREQIFGDHLPAGLLHLLGPQGAGG
jgi:hypothetical protein